MENATQIEVAENAGKNDFLIFWISVGYFGAFTLIGLTFYVFDECCPRARYMRLVD